MYEHIRPHRTQIISAVVTGLVVGTIGLVAWDRERNNGQQKVAEAYTNMSAIGRNLCVAEAGMQNVIPLAFGEATVRVTKVLDSVNPNAIRRDVEFSVKDQGQSAKLKTARIVNAASECPPHP